MLRTLLKKCALYSLLGCSLLLGCQKKDSAGSAHGGKYTESGKTIITGIVLDDNNELVENATITVNGVTLHSDARGVFMGNDVTTTGETTYLTCTKEGYFNSYRTVKTADAGITKFKMVLAKKQQVQNFNASSGINTTISNQAKVTIPGNSIVTATGSAYSGTVTMSSRYMNPTAPNFSGLMPGGDFAAIDANQQNRELYSYGAAEVVLTGSNGQALQLKNGSTATLTFPIQANQLANAPATMPLWYFDEGTGKWKEEGILTKQGNNYVGTVKHFTSWNADKPYPPAYIKGHVDVCNGIGPGVEVLIGGETVITDANGDYEVMVCSGEALTVSYVKFLGGYSSHMSTTVGPLAPNEEKTVDLYIECIREVKGRIGLCDGGSAAGGAVQASWEGGSNFVSTDVNGNFNLQVSDDKEVTLVAYSFDNKSSGPVTLTPGSSQKDLGTLKICQQEQTGEVSFTLNGGGFNNKDFLLNSDLAIIPEALYKELSDETLLNKVGNDGFGIVFSTEGKATGNQQEFKLNITYAKGSEQYVLQSVPDRCVLNISKYGNVGDRVEGTFGGTFEKIMPTGPTGIMVEATKGRFSLVRKPNQ